MGGECRMYESESESEWGLSCPFEAYENDENEENAVMVGVRARDSNVMEEDSVDAPAVATAMETGGWRWRYMW